MALSLTLTPQELETPEAVDPLVRSSGSAANQADLKAPRRGTLGSQRAWGRLGPVAANYRSVASRS